MWRKYYFRILLKLVITASTVISITYFCLRSQHAIILYPSQVIRKDTVGKYSQASNTGIEFVTEKGCWNFSLNPLIRFKLEADVSPDLNYFIRHNQEYLNDSYHQQISIDEQAKHYGSMSAAGIRIKTSGNEKLTLVFSRIWYSKNICQAACNPDRSYICIEAFTAKYSRTLFNLRSSNGNTIRVPSILRISQPEVASCCLGPEDPRIVLVDDEQLLLSFNMIDVDKRRKIWLYELFTGYQVPLTIVDHQPSTEEKNWTPLAKNDHLYFVYSYRPMKILRCALKQTSCEFISNERTSEQVGSLRGGTQLVRFRNTNYFVAIARTTVSCHKCQRLYRPHIVLLSMVAENFHVTYVSEPLALDSIPFFASYFMSRNRNSSDFCGTVIRIMTPGSIIDWEWPEDKLTFTISINDERSFVASVVGLGGILQKVIQTIENEYPDTFFNRRMDLKIVSHSEGMALDYCNFISNIAKSKFETTMANEQYMKKVVVKSVIHSPTFPKFRVASNTQKAVLSSWIVNDYVNFGLIGRYLTEYESVHSNAAAGTHMMIDAGGNHGTYALYGASLNQSVLIFEVLPDYWILIRDSIRLNPELDKRMTLYPFGVSDEYGLWKMKPQEGLTQLYFLPTDMSNASSQSISGAGASSAIKHNGTVIETYPLDDFVIRKVSLVKIDVEGFEIRVLKGARRLISDLGAGALLIEIASKRWSSNNITINEGIAVLEQVTYIGTYLPYIMTREDDSCPTVTISKIDGFVEVKNLSMMNMQDGHLESAPLVFRLHAWSSIIIPMEKNDWSCNFWLESKLKARSS